MAISLDQVKDIFPKHLCLEISKFHREKAKSLAAQYADPVVADRVFLNSLCLEIILPHLKEIFDVKPSSIDSEKIKKYHQEIWQSLNGVAINLPQARLIFIPTEDFDTEELRLKQEWLSSPDLIGDIYLAVQMNLEGSWLRVWGFTSYQELQEQGNYDVSDGSYGIDRSDLWFNLEVLPAIVSQLPRRHLVPPKPVLDPSLRQKILAQIWQPWDELVASLNINLAMVRQSRLQGQWGRKINLGMNLANHSLAVAIGFQEEADHKYFIQVRLYPDNGQMYLPQNLELLILEADGEVFKQVKSREADNWIQLEFRGKLNEEFQVKVQLEQSSVTETITVSSFMSNPVMDPVPITIPSSINDFKIPVFSESWILGNKIEQALGVDLCIAKSDLAYIMGKQIQVFSHTLALVVSYNLEENNNVYSIKLRLYPTNPQRYLPEGFTLLCRDLEGMVHEQETSKPQNNFIEISFSCPVGKELITEVQLQGGNFIERFSV